MARSTKRYHYTCSAGDHEFWHPREQRKCIVRPHGKACEGALKLQKN